MITTIFRHLCSEKKATGYRLQASGYRLQATALVLVLVLGFFLHRVSRRLMLDCVWFGLTIA